MIDVSKECPAWIREFARFVPLKKIFFVYGNILDLISYPVKPPNSEKIYWTENNLPDFFERFLLGNKYEIIGSFDPVEGLTFSGQEMETLYNKTRKGHKGSNSPQDTQDTPDTANDQPGNEPPVSSGKGRQEDSHTPGSQWEPRQEEQPGNQSRFSGRRRGGNREHTATLDDITTVLMNRTVPSAFIFNLASRLVSSPTHLAKEERELFTKILKCSLKAGEVTRGPLTLNNIIILICDKLNDLPSFLYMGNPRVRSIHIPKPDTTERTRFLNRTYQAFYGAEPDLREPPPGLPSYFAALTEGLTNYEMKSLVRLSIAEKIPIKKIRAICERYKYGITESEWDKIDNKRLATAESFLKSRIIGQDTAIASILDIIKRAKIGLSAGSSGKSSRPRGVLFFAGPTGVGKTEITKALAELLFGQQDRCIRFDMSEYSAGHSDEKLLGAPPGYIGYEEGGQLTNAVKERPFSILLFDEIEKAHPKIFDKFLQILDDGRLTDGKGETVYFSESIIIFTSNLGTTSTQENQQEPRRTLIDSSMTYPAMKEIILEAIRDYFNLKLGRPEILNRFGDNFVVFDFIRAPGDRLIVELIINKLVTFAKENREIHLTIEPAVIETVVEQAQKNLHHGGRGIRNAVDSVLVNPLNRALFDGNVSRGSAVRLIRLVDNGENAVSRFQLELEIGS
ncbi:MAG: AAA domain-containing protein [bacterium]|nr:AAA domain-containing protein [bacterium]